MPIAPVKATGNIMEMVMSQILSFFVCLPSTSKWILGLLVFTHIVVYDILQCEYLVE